MILFENDISDKGLNKLFDISNYESKIKEFDTAKEKLKSFISVDVKENSTPVIVHAFIDDSEPGNIKEFFKREAGSTLLYWYGSDLETKLQKVQDIQRQKDNENDNSKGIPFQYAIYAAIALFIFSVFGKSASSAASTASRVASTTAKVAATTAKAAKTSSSQTKSNTNDDQNGIVGSIELIVHGSDFTDRKRDITLKDGAYFVRTGMGDDNLYTNSKSEMKYKIKEYFGRNQNVKKITINL